MFHAGYLMWHNSNRSALRTDACNQRRFPCCPVIDTATLRPVVVYCLLKALYKHLKLGKHPQAIHFFHVQHDTMQTHLRLSAERASQM